MKKILFFKFLSLMMIVSSSFVLFGQDYPINSSYFSFPPKRQTFEANLSNIERIKSIQIPDSILNKTSTKGLFRSCMTHPMLMVYRMAFNSREKAFNSLFGMFNGFRTIFTRSDVGKTFFDIYVNELGIIPDSTSVIILPHLYSRRDVEYFLSSNFIISKMSIDERKELSKTALHNYKYCLKKKCIAPADKLLLCKVIIRTLIQLENKEIVDLVSSNKNVSDFLGNKSIINEDLLSQIINMASNAIENE